MNYSDLLNQASFQRVAAVLGCVYDPAWRAAHPRAQWGQTVQLLDQCFPLAAWERGLEALSHILTLLALVAEHDPDQTVQTTDLDWLVAQVDAYRTSAELGALLSLLRARATARSDYA